MAKLKKDGEQPQAAAEKLSQEQVSGNQADEQKSQKSSVLTTTEGRTIDKIKVYQNEKGATMVSAEYGRLNPQGKTAEERRKNMKKLLPRELTQEKSQQFQAMYQKDPVEAKKFAVREAYPMHVDDAAYHKKDTEINGRKVNYIVLEKLDAAHLDEKNKHLAGMWKISFGEKGNLESRFSGFPNKEEVAAFNHRGEVTFDKEGKAVVKVGQALTMAEIAGRVENRVLAARQEKEAKLASAQKVDWSRFKLPEGAIVTGLRFSAVKDNPDQVMLHGKVNGIEFHGLLSKNESTAVKNKMATLEQVAAANHDVRNKILSALGGEKKQSAVVPEAVVKAVVARASDPSAKRFTPEQAETVKSYLSGAKTEQERTSMVAGIWSAAEPKLNEGHVNEVWMKDAHAELSDLADGKERQQAEGLKV